MPLIGYLHHSLLEFAAAAAAVEEDAVGRADCTAAAKKRTGAEEPYCVPPGWNEWPQGSMLALHLVGNSSGAAAGSSSSTGGLASQSTAAGVDS